MPIKQASAIKIKKNSINLPQESLPCIADKLVVATQDLMKSSKNEEELRIGFEKILEPSLKIIGIDPKPKYERFHADPIAVYHGRPDAVHGQVIFEYERPNAFSSDRTVIHAYEQLVGYMTTASEAKGGDTQALKRLVGVGFDGHKIFFVSYRPKKNGKINVKAFIRTEPYLFNIESARTLLTYLRALSRRPLTAECLADTFGPKSQIAPLAVSAFAAALEHFGKPRVRVFFNEWKRLFGIVYGEHFSAHQREEADALAELYCVGKETDFQELLFSVHTYFAFLMKLIAVELLTLKETKFSSSFCSQLVHSSKQGLLTQLTDMENGGIYEKRGIRNFLEGDFFRWYLDAFSPQLEDAIKEIDLLMKDLFE